MPASLAHGTIPAVFLTDAELVLISAVLGAALGQGGAWVQARRDERRRNEDRQERERERWLAEKRKVYAKFLAEIEGHARDLWKYSVSHRIGPPDIDKRSVTWERVERDMDVTEEVALIAPDDGADAARKANSAVSAYVIAVMEDNHTADDSDKGMRQVTTALAEFRKAARRDLGTDRKSP